jgi:Ribbon-helix-helix domain
VTPKTATAFRIDEELLEGLRLVKDRDGIPISEQVRRAVLMWLESKDVTVKAASRRVQPRRKA